jgi:2-aminoethylphosphonate-pyruvate transaminase
MSERQWILLNPGPANTTATVRDALVMSDLCHREPEFFQIMRSCRERLVALACATPASGSAADWTAVLFTGSGTAAVEATLCSVVAPEGGVLVVDNGVYGARMLKICRAHAIRHHAISSDNVTPVAPADVRRVLRQHPELTHVALVHHETTTGLLNPVEAVAQAAADEGRRVIVDAMSSLFGERLDVTADGIDFVMASANKCLQGVPGVSFVLARRAAVAALRGRAPRSVYLDLSDHYVQQEAENTPFTPAV